MLQKALFIAKASTKVFKKAWLEAKLEKRAVSSLLSSQLLDRKKAREAVVSTLLVSESVARDVLSLETLFEKVAQEKASVRFYDPSMAVYNEVQYILRPEHYADTNVSYYSSIRGPRFFNNDSAMNDFLSRMRNFKQLKCEEYLDAKQAQPALRLTHSRILEEWIRAHALTT